MSRRHNVVARDLRTPKYRQRVGPGRPVQPVAVTLHDDCPFAQGCVQWSLCQKYKACAWGASGRPKAEELVDG